MKNAKEMLKRFGIEDSRSVSTPMTVGYKLTKDQEGRSTSPTEYRKMIGSLLYLTASRPDLMQAVCAASRFQIDPKVFHVLVVK